MSKKTIQQRVADAMTAAGLKEVQGKSRKYRVFRRPGFSVDGRPQFYCLGRAGALRTGQSIAGSLSINAQMWLARHEKAEQ